MRFRALKRVAGQFFEFLYAGGADTADSGRAQRTQRNVLALDELAAIGVGLSQMLQEQPAAIRLVQDLVEARKQTIRAVEDSINRDASVDAADSLHAEFQERLDNPDFADDIETRPAEEVIEEI